MRQLIFLFVSLILGSSAMAVEEPKFEILVQDGKFELRKYAPVIVAETFIDGDMDAASGKGFRAIADYIFGDNKVPLSDASSKIAMTAPVTTQAQDQSSQIAMTAPVAIQPASEGASLVGAQSWRVQFVMPSQYTLANLPKPNNGAVTLREVPEKTVAVARYSGFNTEKRIENETQALVAWMQARHLTATGSAQLARYDPPWTLPMFRRNEIHMEAYLR
jgi:DNA gyrase inhibitor GyrI